MKFGEVRFGQDGYAQVSNAYTREVQSWMGEWQTIAPNLSDAEGKAVKKRIDELNERAQRMLMGS